eukprot:8262563-Pyramimonas_sp.AAC.2
MVANSANTMRIRRKRIKNTALFTVSANPALNKPRESLIPPPICLRTISTIRTEKCDARPDASATFRERRGQRGDSGRAEPRGTRAFPTASSGASRVTPARLPTLCLVRDDGITVVGGVACIEVLLTA